MKRQNGRPRFTVLLTAFIILLMAPVFAFVKDLAYLPETRLKIVLATYLQKAYHKSGHWPANLEDLKSMINDHEDPTWKMCAKERATLKLQKSNGIFAIYELSFHRFAGGKYELRLVHNSKDWR